MARNNRRRRVVVDGFQTRFVVVQLLWVVGALFVFAAALFGPLIYSLLNGGSNVSAGVADQFLLLHRTLWPLLIGLTALLAAVFVRMSHRVAGPLYRFRWAFKEIGEGRLDTTVVLRPGDYLGQERDALNSMVKGLRDRIRESQDAAAELDTFLADRTARSCPLTPVEVQALRVRVRHVTTSLGQFTARSGGFTLIEILIVVTIITILAGLAVPAYTNALETARVTHAVGDMHAINQEVMMHFSREGCWPSSLADIGRDSLLDPWGNPYQYGVIGKAPGHTDLRWNQRDPFDLQANRPRIIRAVYDVSDRPVFLFASQGRGNSGNGNGNGGGNGGSGTGNGNNSSSTCGACDAQCMVPGAVRKDRRLVPINHDFDLYSMGKDGRTNAPLTSSHSLDDVIRADNGSFYGLAKTY